MKTIVWIWKVVEWKKQTCSCSNYLCDQKKIAGIFLSKDYWKFFWQLIWRLYPDAFLTKADFKAILTELTFLRHFQLMRIKLTNFFTNSSLFRRHTCLRKQNAIIFCRFFFPYTQCMSTRRRSERTTYTQGKTFFCSIKLLSMKKTEFCNRVQKCGIRTIHRLRFFHHFVTLSVSICWNCFSPGRAGFFCLVRSFRQLW